ncbi:MAG TPA: carbohydrate-binding protein [Bacillota bacterium]|nr:carbohydrate-binding protein [Bacillota bacterium]
MGILETIRNVLGINATNQAEFGNLDNESTNPVDWSPNPMQKDETLRIGYRGLLKDAGADAVYLHYGYDSWNSPIHTIKMNRLADGDFEVDLHPEDRHEVNFCFKDSASNWDNNNGWNWTVHIS